jgi:AraC-like DNA-binding protein
MIGAGSSERVHSVAKIAAVVDALTAEGVPAAEALDGVGLSLEALSSPATRVSIDQIIEAYCNAARLSHDPYFALHIGRKVHASTYGMYGFALLSGTNFRSIMQFAVKYHPLSAPLADIVFREEGDRAIWEMTPIAHPRIDATMYRFLVELQFGTHWSLMRDVMGPLFVPREFAAVFPAVDDGQAYRTAVGCPAYFNRPRNELVFDAACLDSRPEYGNEITHAAVMKLCDTLMGELELRAGVAGKVRAILLANVMRPTSLEAVAARLHMTARTLRRKLDEEGTSFRKMVDELRMQVAIKYLRDTELTVDDIADALGFSEATVFRRAFRRWTGAGLREFRDRDHQIGQN